MDFITKRRKCKSCEKACVRLVNDEHCMKCYQSLYYQKYTKNKRKKRKEQTSCFYKKAWWSDAYNKR